MVVFGLENPLGLLGRAKILFDQNFLKHSLAGVEVWQPPGPPSDAAALVQKARQMPHPGQ